MIRRDYILRIIEEVIQALAKINALKKGQKLKEASVALDDEFNRFIGAGPSAVARLSDTELLAKLMENDATQAVRQKTLLLTGLLKEAGDVAAAQDRLEESRACYLKGLHLLLHVCADDDVFEWPDFVPKIEWFVESLQDSALPDHTQVLLMQHYERSGEFARAEDALYAVLEAQPANAEALDFGIRFYERLQRHSDAALAGGNLPRAEVDAGVAELRRRTMPQG